ncbi:MAG: hypothetical protein KI790_14965 [Cyclobacteriaceae bacterium]|nr:hypothetical protein [Cyclobacteriaceae bacterium HetDA_MAG_MS6]
MKKIKLEDIDKKNHPFKTPDGYFETLSSEIMSKTSSPTRTSRVLQIPRYAWASAAAMFFLVISVIFLKHEDTPEEFLADVSDEEIMTYLAYYDLSEEELLPRENDFFLELGDEGGALDNLELDDGSIDDIYLEYDIIEESLQI